MTTLHHSRRPILVLHNQPVPSSSRPQCSHSTTDMDLRIPARRDPVANSLLQIHEGAALTLAWVTSTYHHRWEAIMRAKSLSRVLFRASAEYLSMDLRGLMASLVAGGRFPRCLQDLLVGG